MTLPTTRWFLGAIATILLLGATPDARAVVGNGVLKGRSTLTVKRCGRDSGRFTAAVTLSEDGTWTASNPELSLVGTWTPIGTSGRQFALDFAAASFDLFVGPLAADVTQLCRANASPAAITKRRFTLTLNRKRTRAKLALDYRFAGTSPGGAGSGKYVLTGAGRWKAG